MTNVTHQIFYYRRKDWKARQEGGHHVKRSNQRLAKNCHSFYSIENENICRMQKQKWNWKTIMLCVKVCFARCFELKTKNRLNKR